LGIVEKYFTHCFLFRLFRNIIQIMETQNLMTKGQGAFITALLFLLLAVTAWKAFSPPPTAWEYQIVSINDSEFSSKTNELGASGWELVFARRAADGDTPTNEKPTMLYEMIFKRPKTTSP